MPSPKPLPTEVKRRRGTFQPCRSPKALTIIGPVPATLEPPDVLGDAGAKEWRHVLASCPWIGAGDLRVLRLYCIALDRIELLQATLASDGYVLYTDKGYAYLNPAHGALATTEAQLTKWLSLLGLSPSDRGRLGVAEVKAQSKLEELAARRDARLQDGRRAI